jgi:deoxyribonuclease V
MITPKTAHLWDLSPAEAIALQTRLADQVIRQDRLAPPDCIAGVDVGFEEEGKITRAAVAVLAFPSLALIDQATARQETRFPYIPGLLSFREIPAILKALEGLSQAPDLLLCDGQGLAHPRRFGLACHLGLLTDIPAIGVGKTRLIGQHAPLPAAKGSWVPLRDREEVIGAVIRSRTGVKPIYVSIGHRVSLPTAIHYVLAATTRYKLPETTRAAHRLASG